MFAQEAQNFREQIGKLQKELEKKEEEESAENIRQIQTISSKIGELEEQLEIEQQKLAEAVNQTTKAEEQLLKQRQEFEEKIICFRGQIKMIKENHEKSLNDKDIIIEKLEEKLASQEKMIDAANLTREAMKRALAEERFGLYVSLKKEAPNAAAKLVETSSYFSKQNVLNKQPKTTFEQYLVDHKFTTPEQIERISSYIEEGQIVESALHHSKLQEKGVADLTKGENRPSMLEGYILLQMSRNTRPPLEYCELTMLPDQANALFKFATSCCPDTNDSLKVHPLPKMLFCNDLNFELGLEKIVIRPRPEKDNPNRLPLIQSFETLCRKKLETNKERGVFAQLWYSKLSRHIQKTQETPLVIFNYLEHFLLNPFSKS